MNRAKMHEYSGFLIAILFFTVVAVLILNGKEENNTYKNTVKYDSTLTPEKNIPMPPNTGVIR